MLSPLALILLAVAAPAALGIAATILPTRAVAPRVITALLGPATSVAALLHLATIETPANAAVHTLSYAPAINLDLAFRADKLSLFFALLVAAIGALIVLYARGYFGPDQRDLKRFYPLLGFFASSMVGLVLADSFLAMFLFWELTSVSSFLLIGWHREDKTSVRLALQALVITGTGGMLLLAGLIALGVHTNTWSFSELAALQSLTPGPLLTAAFLLIFAGAAAKSAQWPLHFWLPGAMAAPTPVSAYLHSATMVKAGVYLFARLHPAFADLDLWTPVLVSFGATTMLLGAYVAFRATELKRIFAYTTVSQLGLLTTAYGLGGLTYKDDPNLVWPVTQILNHALYKAPLFIIAGAIMHNLHKKHLTQLNGLARTAPVLAFTALGAAWALAGLPFSLSFAAKEAFLEQIAHAAHDHPWFWAVATMAVATAIFNVAIFTRFARTFFAKPDPTSHDEAHDQEHHKDNPLWASCIWWPATLLVAFQFLGGIAPGTFERIFGSLETHPLVWDHIPGVLHAVTHPGPPLVMSAIAIALGLALGFSNLLKRPIADIHANLFPATIRTIESTGYHLFRTVQSGNLRTYLFVVLAALLVGLTWTIFADAERLLTFPDVGSFAWAPLEIQIAAVTLTALICGCALVLPIVRTRVVRVLILGICGFAVTGMYIVYAAPDLALTQIMFEIVSVILFMLALRLLPEELKFRVRQYVPARIVFSAATGIAIAWLMLHVGAAADQETIRAYNEYEAQKTLQLADAHTIPAADTPLADTQSDHHAPHVNAAPERLGGWFLQNSYTGTTPDTEGRGGGGFNVVNVILVDFRGYDTIGEITVLAITLMGVLALLGSVPAPRSVAEADGKLVLGPQPHLRSSLLRSAMKLLVPLILLFAAYVFFKGHNEPGGGFIAGLIASVGLAAYRMTAGNIALRTLVPIKPGISAAIGLAIALATGFAPLAVSLATNGAHGGPFLTSDNQYVGLPGGGTFHWTSVMLFDLGVFIVVVAAATGIVNRFEEELE